MSLFRLSESVVVCGAVAALLWAAVPVAAQHKDAPPDFSSNGVGWVGLNGNGPSFAAVPGSVPPVTQDPAQPFVPNGVGRQPTYRIADLGNPNLKPWVKARMKKDNDEVLAGKIAYTARSSCMPAGVPYFMAYGGATPLFRANAEASLDDLCRRPAGAARLPRRAACEKSKTLMVWRVGRALRG
jgi:hypothetical protein